MAELTECPEAFSLTTLWSYLEPAIGILAANLATFRPLLQRGRSFWSSRGQSGQSKTSDAAAGGAAEVRGPTDRLYPPVSSAAHSVASQHDSSEDGQMKARDVEKGEAAVTPEHSAS